MLKPSLHGLLLIDKDPGMTSHDVVQKVRGIVNIRSVGHAGTLDPIASGLLVLLIGDTTKLSDYILQSDKGYDVDILMGVTTTTLDRDGEVLTHTESLPDFATIQAAVAQITGDLNLPVPAYAATKVAGRKLYEYAREGQEVEKPIKPMRFYDVEVKDWAKPVLKVSLKCSKGSYVRAWAEKLGEVLGCGASVQELRRTYSDPFHVTDAIRISTLREQFELPDFELIKQPYFVPMAQALPHFHPIGVSGKDLRLLLNGQISHHLNQRLILTQKEAYMAQKIIGIKVLDQTTDELVGILEVRPGQGLKIKRILASAQARA